jgi:3-hydroxyacyl-[acyl-carrier-protein] dehydratase
MPGDRLRFEVKVVQIRGNVWKFSGEAFIEDKLAAEAAFTAMVTDKQF